MRLPRRLTAYVAVPTLIMAGLAGCSGDDSADVTDVIIGADLALNSSTDSAYGDALQLRVQQINDSGRLGNKRLKVQIQDNKSDSTDSLRNISTFADNPAVAAVVTGACDKCVVDAWKTIKQKQIPTIALAAASQVTSPLPDRRWLFKIGPNAADDASALVAELQRTNTTKVAVLHSDDLYGTGMQSTLKPLLDKAAITVTATQSIKANAQDITQTVGTLTDGEPQALIVLAGPDQAILAATSAKAAKFKGRLYFDASAAGNLFVPQAAGDAMAGSTMVFTETLAIDDVVATTPAKAARKQWFRDYTSRYGSYSGAAAFAADAADLIAAGVERSGTSRSGIRDVIETSQVDGLSGPIRLTPDNHSGLMPQALTLLVVRSGRWRLTSSQLASS